MFNITKDSIENAAAYIITSIIIVNFATINPIKPMCLITNCNRGFFSCIPDLIATKVINVSNILRATKRITSIFNLPNLRYGYGYIGSILGHQQCGTMDHV